MKRTSCLKWFGGILLLVGILIAVSWEHILAVVLAKEMALSPTSLVFPVWIKARLPIVLDVYLFNCTNTEELSRDFKPNFQEIGPYRFREFQDKVNVTWNDNDTVTYRQQRLFYFDEEASISRTMKENVTMLNMAPVAASYKARDFGNWASFSLSVSMKVLEKTIWVTRSAKELLFQGYSDPLLTLANIFTAGKSKVGFFYGRNGSLEDGYFNMETGAKDMSKIGLIRQWNFSNKTSSFGEGCNDIHGYLGHLFKPKMTKEPFYFFSGEVCKPVKFFFSEEVEMFGIRAYKYLPDMTFMDNGHTDPDTACNCGIDGCLPQGVIDLTNCLEGVPMIASSPHFLNADPMYLENVTGLAPDANRSSFHVILEPTLGIPIELAAHLQYNTLLQRNPKFSLFEDVPDLVFPLFWVRKSLSITEEEASQIKLILLLPLLGVSCGVGIAVLGLLALSITLLPRFYRRDYQSSVTKTGETKKINEVNIPMSNGVTCKKENEENEKELLKTENDNLSKEEMIKTILNCKETDILI